MIRVKRGVTAKIKHKKIIKLAKGYYGARSKTFRSAKQSVIKAYQYSYRDRKIKKRNMRRLWIKQINSKIRYYGITYSKFIYKLKKIKLNLNRKILSEIINNNCTSIEKIIKLIKK